ncbi:MAG: outer membrane beta-barrel protein [Proteobacteria bacterium]|nr:outer membrane beta-barrel protein [Pseudomonadota bacterium]
MRMIQQLGAMACAVVVVGSASRASAEPAAPGPSKVFLEGGLAYGYGMSNAGFLEVDRGARLQGPRSSGAAVDLAGGYALVPNLFVFGDLQYAHASTITGQNRDGDTDEYGVSYTSVSVGLRTAVAIGPGEVYAQMSLGVVLPFETERDQRATNGDTRTTTIGYNTGLGGRGEMGYHYALNDRMYLAAGLRLQAFATDNVGRERVRKDSPSGNVDREVYSTDPNANNAQQAEALSVQDMRIRLGFGYRF